MGLLVLCILGCKATTVAPPPPPTLTYTINMSWEMADSSPVCSGTVQSACLYQYQIMDVTAGTELVSVPISQTSYSFTTTSLSMVGHTVSVAAVEEVSSGVFQAGPEATAIVPDAVAGLVSVRIGSK